MLSSKDIFKHHPFCYIQKRTPTSIRQKKTLGIDPYFFLITLLRLNVQSPQTFIPYCDFQYVSWSKGKFMLNITYILLIYI